jgi:hypothetical protein
VIAFAGLQSALANDAEEIVLAALREKWRTVNLGFVTPANRDQVLPLLRDIATQKVRQIGTVLPNNLVAKMILLRLADQETIEWTVGEYQRHYGSRHGYSIAEELAWAEQAAIIPHLAPDFFRDDGKQSTFKSTGGGETIRVVPQSAFSAFTTLKIVAASAQFPATTRDWARQRRNAGVSPFDALRADMRVWWKQNEAAFQAGNYLAVQPLQPEPHPPPPKLPDPEEARRVLPRKPTPATPPPEERAPAPIPAFVAKAPQANTATRASPAYLWTAIGIILASLAALVARRCKKAIAHGDRGSQ